jgi:hypothetical protein
MPIDSEGRNTAAARVPADGEAFYDADIAPALLVIAKRCQEAGLPFLAMVEYRTGAVGLTIDHPDVHESGPQFRLASYGARCFGNADKLINWLLKDDERHAIGESKSFYLARLARQAREA